jgi:hypothetical protein
VPLLRRVALKLIKIGMNTREVMAHFELNRRGKYAQAEAPFTQIVEASRPALGTENWLTLGVLADFT